MSNARGGGHRKKMGGWEGCEEQQQLLDHIGWAFLQHGGESPWPSAGSAAEGKGDPAAGTLLRVGVRAWRISSVWICSQRREET